MMRGKFRVENAQRAVERILHELQAEGCFATQNLKNGEHRIEIPGWELLGGGATALSTRHGLRLFWDRMDLKVSPDNGEIDYVWKYWQPQTLALHVLTALLLLPYRSAELRYAFAFLLAQLMPIAMSLVIWRGCRAKMLQAVHSVSSRQLKT